MSSVTGTCSPASTRAARSAYTRETTESNSPWTRWMREAIFAPLAGRRAKRDEYATTAPAIPGVFTASSATVPPCEKPISTVRLDGTPKFVCSRRTRSSTSGSTAATRSRWLSAFRPRVGYQSCAAPPRASGSKPLGTTSAALGKRAWNLKAIGIIDCAVAPQPCRNTNRRLVR
jgi:hypothetical protein